MRRALRVPAALALASGVLAAAGCRHLPLPAGPRAIPECSGILLPTRDMPDSLFLRHRLRVRSGETEVALELATQVREDELVLVGIDPLGAKAFTVVQRGTEMRVEALPAPALAVPPENVLRDLHRLLFLHAHPGAPPDDEGRVVEVRDGTRITETWRGGAILSRRFERADGEPDRSGAVVLDFGRGEAHLRNERCGYEAWWTQLAAKPAP